MHNDWVGHVQPRHSLRNVTSHSKPLNHRDRTRRIVEHLLQVAFLLTRNFARWPSTDQLAAHKRTQQHIPEATR
jgi:hypothetical protein